VSGALIGGIGIIIAISPIMSMPYPDGSTCRNTLVW